MSDSTGKHRIEGVPLTDRPKIMRPADHTENYRVQAVFGHELLKEVLAAPDTTAVRHDQLQLDGYEVDLFTSRRWPHVRLTETDGSVATEAPKAGRYHVGFVMYDDRNDERIVVSIDGEQQGVAVAGKDNSTTWLYWLDEPYEFEGGERVQLKALGNSGKHGICNILFLESPPEARDLVYEANNLVAASPVGHTGRARRP